MRRECRELSNQITALADQEISAKEAERIELHLENCPHCRHELEGMIRMQGWMRRSWPDIEPSIGFEQRFMDALDQEKASQRTRTSWLVTSRRWAVACVLAFSLITGGIWLTQKEKGLTLDQVIISTQFELINNMEVIKNLEALDNYELLLAMNNPGISVDE